MPTDDLPELDPEQQNRIKSMAESCRYLKTKTNLDFSTIMTEVQKDYQRTMNKIIFDNFYKDPKGMELIPIDLTLPQDELEKPPTPYFGMV